MTTTSTKPIVKGPVDGNIFSVAAACSNAMRRAGLKDKVNEMSERILNSDSYDAALRVCMDYVDFDLGDNSDDDDSEEQGENEEDDA